MSKSSSTIKLMVEDVVHSLYCTTKRTEAGLWPRVYSWDEFMEQYRIGNPWAEILRRQLWEEAEAIVNVVQRCKHSVGNNSPTTKPMFSFHANGSLHTHGINDGFHTDCPTCIKSTKT